MTPYFHDDHLTVYQGDCREVMAAMEPESVHCVVTSPPYWGLRDYGTATWVGGEEGCDHANANYDRGGVLLGHATGGPSVNTANNRRTPMGPTCRKCGAVRQDSQLGLEPTPEAFVANMVDVFREVRRVLRKDGTLWLNLGDSYAAARGGTTMPAETLGGGENGWMADGSRVNRDRHDGYSPSRNASAIGLKHKDLVGIPWRVAFALQADGWYLRSDIIWSKPNPMPESVTDRPTKAHEYLFLLSKSPRYFFDADAVREAVDSHPSGNGFVRPERISGGLAAGDTADWQPTGGRNLRSVWNIATEPYPGAHFATFPRKLVEPCVKAGTSERGVCGECGDPWGRVVKRERQWDGHSTRITPEYPRSGRPIRGPSNLVAKRIDSVISQTLEWFPICAHDAEPVAATVLDPFAGSGTTGMVAQALGRRAVLIDLNGEYLVQAMNRNAQTPLGMIG